MTRSSNRAWASWTTASSWPPCVNSRPDGAGLTQRPEWAQGAGRTSGGDMAEQTIGQLLGLIETGTAAAELSRRVAASDVSEGTLCRLEAMVDELATRYP